MDEDDTEDPHDLSFPSSLPPRASMVENMALALDQFSSGMFDSSPNNFGGRSNSYDLRSSRGRGHTFSSSVSSEGDIRDMRTTKLQAIAPRTTPKDTTRHQKNLNKLPSIFGEDEDSVRAKVFDAQRAGPSKPKSRRLTKGSSNSATSSIDLGHLAAYTGRLGHAGDRRSRSFDFGSRTRPNKFDISDGPYVAHMPVISAGPESRSSPTKSDFAVSVVARRNSNKSSKIVAPRKPRAGTIGTATVKPKASEAPPMPVRQAPTVGPADLKTSTDASLAPRPGFFRRVFGSSRTASHNDLTAPPQSARPSQDLNTPPNKGQRPVRNSLDLSANKENQPTLQKKPSSFFRRRKKSISSTTPPPLPLTLGPNNNIGASIGEQSPISSLRAFMDPYLATSQSEGALKRDEARDVFHTPDLGSPDDDNMKTPTKASRHPLGQADGSGSRSSSVLRVPQQQSFLADSSSSEEKQQSSRTSTPNTQIEPWKAAVSQSANLTPRNASFAAAHDSDISTGTTQKTISQNTTGRNDVPAQIKIQARSSKASAALELVASNSPVSEYRSAPSTPVSTDDPGRPGPAVHHSHSSVASPATSTAKDKAQKIFDNADEELDQDAAAAWLGDAGDDRGLIRTQFMELFDFAHINTLASLRRLCDRIILKGETQQMDRLLLAFALRWCECNPNHGFKSSDVVHTICYSILLLNTDLHLADIGQKMTKNQFVRNALPTIRRVADEHSPADSSALGVRRTNTDDEGRVGSADNDAALRTAKRPTVNREDSADMDINATGGPLIDAPFKGTERGWDAQVEQVLRAFYSSISQKPLPLFGSTPDPTIMQPNSNFLGLGAGMLRRTPSTISKAQSDMNRPRHGTESKSLGARWVAKARSRPRLPSAPGFASSRTSLDDGSSNWSPSMSSTWSKNSIGKTLTSMSVDSFGTEITQGDYQSSIGFANALSQAIIREDQFELNVDEGGLKTGPLLEDESLELCGAPWAKEGILKHKCHLEGVDKRSKDRNWNDCFAVIERGWMRLFSFSMTAKSLRTKAKNQKTGGVVGGGNWQDNAEEVWKFMLRHAIASALPPPGYSKTRPYVWALSLPTGAVHLFSVGTPDIVKEFVSTANFWSARLSKEPMVGGVSNMEYGWSDAVVNRALINSESSKSLGTAASGSRPSTQMSVRSSIDQNGAVRPKLPGDRAYINDWNPPQQSMFASQLLEVDQLRALQTYVNSVEEELQRHNELRGAMQLAYSPKHINSAKSMNNWEKKSSYLLREIVKFRTYIDTLQHAQSTKERIHKLRRERQAEEDAKEVTAPDPVFVA